MVLPELKLAKWPFKWFGIVKSDGNGGSLVHYDSIEPSKLRLFHYFKSGSIITIVIFALGIIWSGSEKSHQITVNTKRLDKVEVSIENYNKDSVTLKNYCDKTDRMYNDVEELKKAMATLPEIKSAVDKTYYLLKDHIMQNR